ncbi:small nucleolar ribonucleoprotein-like protein complex subunit [Lindgomyces ingoldianus]|uniref:Small nucleolar ribonucleoprotein-like protein complex subunit n=1 Tax=Lindgomyces ingoldianus TaxID=673940 RepID=A0ACB6RBG9_9PLEO|nr:small nucleolar ribonucleoprotein-like protein complex subunit [Lindgomyces ingoldianus]KAF2476447.1 small nucleolar ribonucleoprotein-like protein complex subunit [Lindgomyces ingoldianus]
MDIHRSRFVPYPPSAINALAFSHAASENDNEDLACLRLALGRANGNIEIWNPNKGSWLQERVFSGGKDRSAEGLVWTQDADGKDERGNFVPGRLRLFSIGYSTSITEWDLVTGLPARHSNGNHSDVWCFAAQPKLRISEKSERGLDASLGQNLVAGCADGTLVLLSTGDNNLRFDKFLARSSTKKARVLSVTYKDRNTVLAGFADSMIRVFDTRSGRILRNISLGSGPPGGPRDILVWKVRCLPNGDFVSGDSTGDIRIYDGQNFGQLQRISGHEADVLDLAISKNGNMIFSGGMDRRTCFYTCNKKSGAARGYAGDRWCKVSHQRYHDHDVKAMATYEGKQLNVMVSGGIDTQPVVVPLRQYGRELSRKLPALPHEPPLVSASNARLLVSWWNTEVQIWRVKQYLDVAKKPKLVARIALRGEENITSVTITEDGGLLAAATAAEVKLFQLGPANLASGSGFRIRKLEIPWKAGAKLVRFSSDGKWLALISATNNITFIRVIRQDVTDRPRAIPRILRLHRLPRNDIQQDPLNGPWGHYSRSITHAGFCPDGTVFAVADLAGYVDSWLIEGHEDPSAPEVDVDESSASSTSEGDDGLEDEDMTSQERTTILGQGWVPNPSGHLLPRLDSPPLLLSFRPRAEGSIQLQPNGNPTAHYSPHPHLRALPKAEQHLLLVSANHQLYQFEVLGSRLSDWSRRNPPSTYPSKFRLLDDPVKGCTWDVANGYQRLWLHGEKWLFMFDLAVDLPLGETTDENRPAKRIVENRMVASKKRKREPIKEISRKKKSGAGDAVPENETMVTKVRKFHSGKTDESDKLNWIDLNKVDRVGAESDEDFNDTHQALATLRRSGGYGGQSTTQIVPGNGEVQQEEALQTDLESQEKGEDLADHKRRVWESWWHTFKYRPILGMVPIGGDNQPLEVVLVERPSFDLDLPPRFISGHD